MSMFDPLSLRRPSGFARPAAWRAAFSPLVCTRTPIRDGCARDCLTKFITFGSFVIV